MTSSAGERVQEVVLDRGGGVEVRVNLHGATITSWKMGDRDLLFLSPSAAFDGRTPIRGGIPLVFPHFGPWAEGKPKHGFARTKRWSVVQEPTSDANNGLKTVLGLEADADTKAVWDYEFSLRLSILLTEQELSTTLLVQNTGSETFEFHALFHNYFRVSDVESASVSGFAGLDYADTLLGGAKGRDEGVEGVAKRIEGPVDRVYSSTPRTHLITDHSRDFSFALTKSPTLPETVLWNPWAEGAKKMKDLDDDAFRNFICVEPGAVGEKVRLEGGGVFEAKQTITISPTMNV